MKKQRLCTLDLLKLFSITGVLIIHLIGKVDNYGCLWYAQAVPIFMVIMGYNAKNEFLSSQKLLSIYIPYGLVFLISFIGTLIKPDTKGELHNFLPIGFLPVPGPGDYWIILFFCCLFIGPLLARLMVRIQPLYILMIVFVLSYMFEYMTQTNGGG